MINNVVPRLTVRHTKSQVSPISLFEKSHTDVGPVETRITYINNFPIDVVVVDRNGFRHSVPAQFNGSSYKFTIRKEIRVRNESIREVKKYLSCIDTKFNHDLTIIKQIVLEKDGFESYNGFSIYLDYSIELEELKQDGGDTYCKPADIIVSLQNIYNAPAHPFSEDSIHDHFIPEGAGNQTIGSPVFKIEMVDNNNQVGNRFVFAFGGLQEIRPKTDLNRDSGVYLTMMEPNVLNDKGFTFVQKKYSYEEAKEKLGLYKSREEAASAGDYHLTRKEELARLEHANNLLKQESIELKAKLDKEAALRDKELKDQEAKSQERINKLQAEKDEIEHFREMERNQRKEEYDKKSTERKDTSEIIKFLPFVVMTIGALIAAFHKSSK